MERVSDEAWAQHPTAELVEAVGAVLADLGRGRILNPPRVETMGRFDDPGWFRLEMPATLLDARGQPWLSGAKILDEPGSRAGRTARTELHDLRTDTWAWLDADRLTDLRTGAAAVWALRWIHGSVDTLAILGTGRVARWAARAADQLLGVRQLRVTSRNPDNRARFAADVAGLRAELVLCDDAEAACSGADAVIAAAPVAEPLLTTERIRTGVTAVAVEGDPRVVLVEAALLRERRVVVDLRPQALQSGSLLALSRAPATIEIGALACGAAQVGPGAVVVFTGLGALDVALGARIWLGEA